MLNSEFSQHWHSYWHSYTKYLNAVDKFYENENECDFATSYIE